MTEPKGRNGSSPCKTTIPFRANFPVNRIVLSDDRKNRTSLRIPVYEGELHYFYSNYRDYYYLKKEDMAIHKSVASFVDKEYRENAKASNCYTRKSGKFLPQYNSVMQPEFRKEYKDKISYFEMTDDFCTSDIMLHRYIDHILKNMMGKK